MTATDASSVTVTRYAYGSHPEQFGDLRLPAGAGPHPTLVYVHGGGYRANVTLDGAAAICSALTAAGFATWSVEYRRLGNGGGWPTTFDDVRVAAAHVRTLAGEAHLDLSRVCVGGQSAGGQLALWLASHSVRLTADDASSATAARADAPTFRGVIALAPLTDVRAWSLSPTGAGVELLGGTPDQVSERYAAVSPLELAPLGLPQLVVHGTADHTVDYHLSERYVSAARNAGDQVELVTIDGADHLDLWRPTSPAFDQTVAAVVNALRTWTT